jgi:alpha-N-arabinofuranosidase
MSDGTVNVNLANADLDNSNKLVVNLNGIKGKIVNARILTSKDIKDHNTFDNPNKVVPVEFKEAKINKKGELVVEMPKMSIVTLQIK